MIRGVVTPDLQAVIHLAVRGKAGREEEIEFVVDTGFNTFLSLPSELIARLNLSKVGVSQAVLADGSEVELAVYEAVVLWNGAERDVTVLESDGALVGVAMLRGCELKIEVVDGGGVSIKTMLNESN